jgi:hydrogenase maturation protease
VECLSLGGLNLMEHLLGYERAIIVDSMETGQSPAGSVQIFPLASLPDPMSGHSASAHDTSLMTALKTAEVIGVVIPKQVDVVAIEAKNVYDFSEELSPPVSFLRFHGRQAAQSGRHDRRRENLWQRR